MQAKQNNQYDPDTAVTPLCTLFENMAAVDVTFNDLIERGADRGKLIGIVFDGKMMDKETALVVEKNIGGSAIFWMKMWEIWANRNEM